MHAIFFYGPETTMLMPLVVYQSGTQTNCIWIIPSLECPF